METTTKEKTETIVVSALKPLNSMPIKLAYRKEGNTVFITRDGTLRSMPTHEFDKAMGKSDESKALNVGYLKHKAAKKNRTGELSHSYTVKVDEEGTILRVEGATGDQAYGIFFTDCVFAEVDGKKSSLPPLVSVTYINKAKKTVAVDTRKEMKVIQLLDEMTLTEIQNVCSLLSMPSFGKTKDELFATLVDRKTGVIFIPANMELFWNTYELKINKDSELQILVNKAIELNAIRITQKDKQKEMWFSDTLIGYDKQAAILFLKKDELVLRALKLSVDMKLDNGGNEPREDLLKEEVKPKEAEILTMMRAALELIRKTPQNPAGVYDIGTKNIITVKKDDIRAAYNKYVLKKE